MGRPCSADPELVRHRSFLLTVPGLQVLAILAVLACGLPAGAQSACVEPTPPLPTDGATATMDQIRAATAAAKKYLADSDDFQTCLVNEIAAIDLQREAPKAAALQKQLDARTQANQARKESVGDAINAAIRAYKAAHP
jgi:hypothetical protein